MENGNPIEQIKGFAEKKLYALRENPDESGTRAYLAKMRKGSWKKYLAQIQNFGGSYLKTCQKN
mgnify:FL=1